MTSTPSIVADTLTLRYGDATALDRVSFSLAGPGIHGLLGRNGSGKTSLLSILSGLRKPSEGGVRLFGQPVFENRDVTSRCCIIREDGDMIDSSETIASAFIFEADMRPFWNADRAHALLETFELSPKKKLSALSRGQRSAVACTIGIAAQAPVTLFDESYLGMDAPSRYAFYDALLADFLENPRLIMLSTHLIDEVARLFEEVLIIHDGRLLLHDSAENLRGRGLRLIGPADIVSGLAAGLTILDQRDLGPTRSIAIDGPPPDLAARAKSAGVAIEALPIQDVFIHLTAREKDKP